MKKQKIYRSIIVFALLAAFSSCSAGSQCTTIPLTIDEIKGYKTYSLHLPDELECEYGDNIIEFVLKNSKILETRDINGMHYTAYSEGNISEYLYNCGAIKEVSTLNRLIYIRYYTSDNLYVILNYSAERINDLSIYDESKDEAVYISDEKNERYTNYLHGNSNVNPDGAMAQIIN